MISRVDQITSNTREVSCDIRNLRLIFKSFYFFKTFTLVYIKNKKVTVGKIEIRWRRKDIHKQKNKDIRDIEIAPEICTCFV